MADVPSRHEQRKAATRQSLLDAARDVIAAKGYNETEILDITEGANVSKATFYKHFVNKEDCVRELMQQGFDALVAQINSVDRSNLSTPDWVRQSFEQAFQWADAHRVFLLLMVGGAASPSLNTFGRNYMVEVTRQQLNSHFTARDTTPRFPADIEAQIVTGIMVQLLGWWLENNTGYSAADMAQFIQLALKHGTRISP
ncbi:MAG: TetR/AcrR family transcriptional regulator [Chloroflexi bacterium]|nr:TetR/AcrR family transcriptional regulator [Chloroflexota bacterium]